MSMVKSNPVFKLRGSRRKEAQASAECGVRSAECGTSLLESSAHSRAGAAWIIFISLLLLAGANASAQVSQRKPKADNPAKHAFPALGSSYPRQVEVAWNQYYDTAGLASILARLNKAFPRLTKLYSIGKSHDGRDLWCLEITAPAGLEAARKPGMYIDGNIHGNEVQGGEVVAYTAWYLCHQYGKLEAVTDLLDHYVFYLVPTINPDGRDRWLHTAQNPSTSRSGLVPEDNDRDGRADEDDCDDLDGDGSITQMRIKDPHGRWKSHPKFPEYLMIPAAPDEPGEYTMLGAEGLDNDGDGLVNEDPAGGYDMNRNWAFDWQPNYIQYGAREYPFSLPETRAVAEFILHHPNIAAAQSYHNAGGMILRGPGREGGAFQAEDDQTMRVIAQRGEQILPFYRSMTIWKDLYSVWGGELDWLYGARGILSFTCEIWNSRSLEKTNTPPSREDEAEFLKYVLLNDGVVQWHEFDHPTFGKIEIGGTKKTWGRTPVSFLLEEECHRNMAFTLYHAAQMPRLAITDVKTEPLGDGLFSVWVEIENARLIPTRTRQDASRHISPPDIVTLAGPDVKVLSAGRVTDRFFKRVEAVKRRPERVELETIPGLSAARVRFIVSGCGRFKVSVDSAKGGLVSAEHALP